MGVVDEILDQFLVTVALLLFADQDCQPAYVEGIVTAEFLLD